MNYKWIGAILIIAACGGVGFSMAGSCRKRVNQLKQLIHSIQFMENELQYRLTPLPELCRITGKRTNGSLGVVFLNLARELDWQAEPEVANCMAEAIRKSASLSGEIKKHLFQLGGILGRYDLTGQLKELQAVRTECEGALRILSKDKDVRMRSYQTLGLCAGAALAILLA